MRYAYYPGCSLKSSAEEFDISTRRVMERMGAVLTEIEDWTCCGAAAVENVSKLLTYTLPARNMALAERDTPETDMLVPCAACYLNHRRVQEEAYGDKALMADINEVLSVEDLSLAGEVKVRHLLDALITDYGPEEVKGRVVQPLEGLVVAPYYGCQVLRPYRVFDAPESPTSMDVILEALGAEVLPFAARTKCCGASLMTTKRDTALKSVADILQAAQGADCIATVCPMCQMNLEAFQSEAIAAQGRGTPVSVVYLPQLMGLAMGLAPEEIGLEKNLAVKPGFMQKIAAHEQARRENNTVTV